MYLARKRVKQGYEIANNSIQYRLDASLLFLSQGTPRKNEKGYLGHLLRKLIVFFNKL